MSHLDHIVKVKQDLIEKGVTNPQKQIDVIRTAYVKALIVVNQANHLNEEDCVDFNRYILGYWNETTPVAGHMVMTLVGNFFRALQKATGEIFIGNTIEIEVCPKIEGVSVDFAELETYKNLISTLIGEANHKLPKFIETNQIA